MAWSITNPFLGKNRPKTPQQWVRFPWEKEQKRTIVKIDEQQIVALNDLIKDFHKRKTHN